MDYYFNEIMEVLNRVPTNIDMGVYLYALNDWFAARTIVLIPAFTALGVVVYKTPWKWDNKLFNFIANKIGFKKEEPIYVKDTSTFTGTDTGPDPS